VASRRRGGERAGELLESDVLGNVTPELRALARSTFDVVHDYARHTWPHLLRDVDAYRYSLRFSKDDEPSSGTSAGLPMAIALLSLLLDRPVPQHTCLTGTLVGDSVREVAVRRVGDAVYKVKGAYHRGLRRIIVPADNRDDVESGELVPGSIAKQLVRYARNLDDAVRELWGEEAWDW
jgi:ATP-dependent Lon protease